MRPRHRRELGRWTHTVFALSTRRVSGLMIDQSIDHELPEPTRSAARAANADARAGSDRVRVGYRRLTVMLRREGWAVNAKRIYRLYTSAMAFPPAFFDRESPYSFSTLLVLQGTDRGLPKEHQST